MAWEANECWNLIKTLFLLKVPSLILPKHTSVSSTRIMAFQCCMYTYSLCPAFLWETAYLSVQLGGRVWEEMAISGISTWWNNWRETTSSSSTPNSALSCSLPVHSSPGLRVSLIVLLNLESRAWHSFDLGWLMFSQTTFRHFPCFQVQVPFSHQSAENIFSHIFFWDAHI